MANNRTKIGFLLAILLALFPLVVLAQGGFSPFSSSGGGNLSSVTPPSSGTAIVTLDSAGTPGTTQTLSIEQALQSGYLLVGSRTNTHGTTTQINVSNPAGTTMRLTWNTVGTDPTISCTNYPIGRYVEYNSQNGNAANNGSWLITGCGGGYIEATNAAVVVEANKAVGAAPTYYLGYSYAVPSTSLALTGLLSGGVVTNSKAAAYTVGTDNARECYGGVIYVTDAAVITSCAGLTAGMSFSVVTIGAVAVSVKAQAADKIWLNGAPLDDADKITNTSTAGDTAVCIYYSADGWFCKAPSWTDGGA